MATNVFVRLRKSGRKWPDNSIELFFSRVPAVGELIFPFEDKPNEAYEVRRVDHLPFRNGPAESGEVMPLGTPEDVQIWAVQVDPEKLQEIDGEPISVE